MATRSSLRLRREPLTAIPRLGARENAITYCISDGRLNQQQRRCGEEQKVFHDILPAFLELATDAATSWRFELRAHEDSNAGPRRWLQGAR
jgi:hypothetical protein